MKRICAMSLLLTAVAFAQDRQWVEGFDKVEFHHDAARNPNSRDFRGMARGYMTAGWWAPGQMKKNLVSWKTAVVPARTGNHLRLRRRDFCSSLGNLYWPHG